jgi:hypothetical protein
MPALPSRGDSQALSRRTSEGTRPQSSWCSNQPPALVLRVQPDHSSGRYHRNAFAPSGRVPPDSMGLETRRVSTVLSSQPSAGSNPPGPSVSSPGRFELYSVYRIPVAAVPASLAATSCTRVRLGALQRPATGYAKSARVTRRVGRSVSRAFLKRVCQSYCLWAMPIVASDASWQHEDRLHR